jgi:hypothetical protein
MAMHSTSQRGATVTDARSLRESLLKLIRAISSGQPSEKELDFIEEIAQSICVEKNITIPASSSSSRSSAHNISIPVRFIHEHKVYRVVCYRGDNVYTVLALSPTPNNEVDALTEYGSLLGLIQTVASADSLRGGFMSGKSKLAVSCEGLIESHTNPIKKVSDLAVMAELYRDIQRLTARAEAAEQRENSSRQELNGVRELNQKRETGFVEAIGKMAESTRTLAEKTDQVQMTLAQFNVEGGQLALEGPSSEPLQLTHNDAASSSSAQASRQHGLHAAPANGITKTDLKLSTEKFLSKLSPYRSEVLLTARKLGQKQVHSVAAKKLQHALLADLLKQTPEETQALFAGIDSNFIDAVQSKVDIALSDKLPESYNQRSTVFRLWQILQIANANQHTSFMQDGLIPVTHDQDLFNDTQAVYQTLFGNTPTATK